MVFVAASALCAAAPTVRPQIPAGALGAVSVPVTLHSGLGLIHGCFDMLGVTAAARDEIDRVLRSVREALANDDREGDSPLQYPNIS